VVWVRLRELLPPTLEAEGVTWDAVGLNECWRLAKYLEGDRFGAHCDTNFERTDDERSMYTVNIYMNDVPKAAGGATRFYSARRDQEAVVEVAPKVGLGVCFRQPPEEELVHDGQELTAGLKYLFRSDVMYRRR